MPDFLVKIQRVVTHTSETTIKAKDEDAASEKADALINDDAAMSKLNLDWELDDESFEVLEVNEE